MMETPIGRDADLRPAPNEELVSFSAPKSLEAEQYRSLRHAIERLHRDAHFQVFGITSAGAGDGKTVTTLNLAGSLAQSPDARVLVVCADFHRPAVTEYLGLARACSPGLAEAIVNDNFKLDKAIRRFDSLNLSILPAGDVQSRPDELLASPRFERLLNEMRRLYDYVLIDTPPVVPVADCRFLARWVDGFIVVVAAHRTPKKLLAEALSILEPAEVVGMVFNGDDQSLAAYSRYYGPYSTPA